MRVLVTGASGFTGSRLVEKLVSDGNVVGVFTRNPNSTTTSVTEFSYSNDAKIIASAVEEFRPDVFIHIASMVIVEHSMEMIPELIEANVTIPTLILDALVANNCKNVVVAGTSWQNFDGTNQYVPANLYAATKQAFGDICKYYVDANGIAIAELRIMDIYGEGDKRPKLLRLLEKCFYGETDHLDMTKGEQEIDLIHVDDVVEAFIHVAKSMYKNNSSGMDIYRIGTGRITNLIELVELINNITGRELDVSLGKRPYRKREVMKVWRDGNYPDGWQAKISLEEGLRRIFVRENHK